MPAKLVPSKAILSTTLSKTRLSKTKRLEKIPATTKFAVSATARFLMLFLLTMLSTTVNSQTLDKRTICAWDPVGNNGPVIQFFADLIPKALSWGLSIEFVPYEDENKALTDFIEKKCDMAIVTAILSRDIVPFAGTLDAIGGITSEQKLKMTLAAIASPKAEKLMTMGEYEVVASLPVGSMFAFVNDRNIKDIRHFRNKRIAILNNDIQTKKFAELTGGIPVNTTLMNFSSNFNNGNLDIVIMPALAYDTFELYKGLGDKGGILDLRLFYGMIQAIVRKSDFPDDFGTKVRRYIVNKVDTITDIINKAEKTIPHKYWIKANQQTEGELAELYKDIRLRLKVNKQFDARALSLLFKIRCLTSPEREECVSPK